MHYSIVFEAKVVRGIFNCSDGSAIVAKIRMAEITLKGMRRKKTKEQTCERFQKRSNKGCIKMLPKDIFIYLVYSSRG